MSRPRFRHTSDSAQFTSRRGRAPLARARYRPSFDVVESRLLLATVTVLPMGQQFTTITAAVNYANAHPNPNNIVSVGPGTYNESNITIASPLTLISTNGAASTIIDGGNVTEAQTGVIRDINTMPGAVTIGKPGQGFTIQNPPTRANDNYVGLIDVENIGSPLIVQNNVLTGRGAGSNAFDIGVYVQTTTANASVTVQNNTLQQMFQGVLYDLPIGGGSIQGNTFQNLQPSNFTYTDGHTATFEPEGAFAVTYGGPANNVSGLQISANNFANFNGLAINVSGGYAGLAPAQFSNVQITNNVVTSIGFAANQFRAGITLIDDADSSALESQGGVVNSTVSGNTLQAQTSCAAGSVGVWVLGADNNLTIENNFIQNLDSGVKISEQVAGAGYASGLLVIENSFTGNNISIQNPSPNTVNASYNYYGTVDETSVKAQNNGGVNVDYNPWLGDGSDTSPNPGFQPNLTPLYTDTVQVSGNDSVLKGNTYSIFLNKLVANSQISYITSYTVNFGDGTVQQYPTSNSSVVATHTYTPNSQTTYIVSATATNQYGTTFQIANYTISPTPPPATNSTMFPLTNGLPVTVTQVATLVVTTFTPTVSGFAVRFNDAINTADLNLYTGADSNANNAGAPDVTLTGPSGNVNGSLKLDADNKGFTFVKTGAPLPAGNYTATLFATHTDGTPGIVDANTGNPLDGAATGSTTGSNYTMTFTAPAATGATLSIPDFARGPNQSVIVPNATGSGLPVRISAGTGVTTVMLVITYDPALLTINGVTLAPTIPAGAQFVMNATIPGRLALCFNTNGQPLSSPAQDIFELSATVPGNAPYRAKDLITVQSTSINNQTTVGQGDQAIHAVAYLGDADGNGRLNGTDAARISQAVANSYGINSGFGRYPLVDPVIIGGVNSEGSTSARNQNNRTLSGQDAALVSQFVANDPTPQIPPPGGTPTNFASGPDPLLFIPQNLAARPGGSVAVPVRLLQTNGSAVGLDSFDLVLKFDPKVFQFLGTLSGNLPGGFQITTQVDATHGLIFVTGTSLHAVSLAPGTLSELVGIEFHVLAGAGAGQSPIAILANWGNETTSLDGGWLTLVPAPTNAPNNPINGVITIGTGASASSLSSTSAVVQQGPSAALLLAHDLAIAAMAGNLTGQALWIPLVPDAPVRPPAGSRSTASASRTPQSAPSPGIVVFSHRGIRPKVVPTDEVE